MLFSKALAEGVQVGGFVDSPSMVLVTWKSESGEQRTSTIEVGGIFCEDMAIKGRVLDIIAVPVLKTRRTLYVSRLVKNADEIGDWFRAQGMPSVMVPGEMHVTIAYSKSEVDWEALDAGQDHVTIPLDRRRTVEPLGDKGAMVLKFQSPALHSRWAYFRKAGASWDYPSYQPHATLTYKANPRSRFIPFSGPIILGPEQFGEVNENWSDSVTEKAILAGHASAHRG